MQRPRTVGIIGGGIAGLVSAYYLAQRATVARLPSLRILLFERSSRFGGWIDSKQLGEKYDSHIFEAGPRTLRLASGVGSLSKHTAVNTLKLLEQLNLFDEEFCPIEKNAPTNRNRLIYHQQQLVNLNDLSLIFGGKPLKYPPIVYALYEYFSKEGRHAVQDETIKSFITRRFGNVLSEEIVEYLLDPVMKGVYAGGVTTLSARTVLKKFFELEQRHGSLIAGLLKTRKDKLTEEPKHRLFPDLDLKEHAKILDKYAIYYFRSGMEVLVQRLIKALATFPNVELMLNQSIEQIQFQEKSVELLTRSKKTHHLDHLVSAVPAFDFANLLDDRKHSVLKSRLKRITFVNMIVINLLYGREDIYPKEAFGYLIPSRAQSHLLGVLFDSCVRHRTDGKKRGSQLTVMMGGEWFDELRLGQCTDEQLMHRVRSELKKQMNLDEEPVHYCISRMNGAIPVGEDCFFAEPGVVAFLELSRGS